MNRSKAPPRKTGSRPNTAVKPTSLDDVSFRSRPTTAVKPTSLDDVPFSSRPKTAVKPTSLDDVPFSSRPKTAVKPTSLDDVPPLDDRQAATPANVTEPVMRRHCMDEAERIKSERADLCVEMEAVLAAIEAYEYSIEIQSQEGQVRKLQSDIEEEEKRIQNYMYCLETIPSCIEAQAAIDKVKDEAIGLMMNSEDGSKEETSEIHGELENLRTSLDTLKSVLLIKNISLPLGELEETLDQCIPIFEPISGLSKINCDMKKITELATLLDRLIVNLEKIDILLKEKDRLTTHLASLRTSMMVYASKNGAQSL